MQHLVTNRKKCGDYYTSMKHFCPRERYHARPQNRILDGYKLKFMYSRLRDGCSACVPMPADDLPSVTPGTLGYALRDARSTIHTASRRRAGSPDVPIVSSTNLRVVTDRRVRPQLLKYKTSLAVLIPAGLVCLTTKP
jgi:hypothetical protein